MKYFSRFGNKPFLEQNPFNKIDFGTTSAGKNQSLR